MLKEFSDNQFYDAYYKQFSKKYDLSPLSDINLDDHKILMEKAASKFVEHNMGQEEIPDVRYAIWRIHETVHKILKAYTLEESLQLLDEVDFYQFNTYEQYLEAASQGKLSPFAVKVDLKKALSKVIKFWEQNKAHIIKTGYPETLISLYPWIPGLFMNLYPEKRPVKIKRLEQIKSGDFKCKYYWNEASQEDDSEHEIDSAQTIIELFTGFKEFYPWQYRSKIFDVFLDTFKKLEYYLSGNNKESILSELFQNLYKHSGELITDCLAMDVLMRRERQKHISAGKFYPNVGGFSKLFILIGYCDKEQRLPLSLYTEMLTKMRKASVPFLYDQNNQWNKFGPINYIDIYKGTFEEISIDKKSVDGLMKDFLKYEQDENDFWANYYVRLNKILHEEFKLSKDIVLRKQFVPYKNRVIAKVNSEYKENTIYNILKHISIDNQIPKLTPTIEKPIIELPPHTDWKDLTIEIDKENGVIYLSVPGKKFNTVVDTKEFDIWGKRKKNIKEWDIFASLASPNSMMILNERMSARKKAYISRLNKLLKITFGLRSNPIISKNKKFFHRLNISLFRTDYSGIAIQDWYLVRIRENEFGNIEFKIPKNIDIDDWSVNLSDIAKREKYYDDSPIEKSYSLYELSLVLDNGQLKKDAKLFLTLLRNNGKIYLEGIHDYDLISHLDRETIKKTVDSLSDHLSGLFNSLDKPVYINNLEEELDKKVIESLFSASSAMSVKK